MKSTGARKPKAPVPRESEVQKSAIAILRGLGFVVFRRNVGGRKWTDKRGRARYMAFAEPGQSDVYGWLPGGPHVEVEIKRPGEWPTKEQIAWLRETNASGAVGFWVSSTADLERVARYIMGGGRIDMRPNGQYMLA